MTVDLAVSGTAAATDYNLSATQVVIAAGATSGSVTVTAVNDTDDEDNETVVIDIDAVTNGNEDGAQQATTTITDDDGPASFAVSSFNGNNSGFTAALNAARRCGGSQPTGHFTADNFGVADVTLSRSLPAAPVAGSLVVEGDSRSSFLATGGALAADTYTATLRSAVDGC